MPLRGSSLLKVDPNLTEEKKGGKKKKKRSKKHPHHTHTKQGFGVKRFTGSHAGASFSAKEKRTNIHAEELGS